MEQDEKRKRTVFINGFRSKCLSSIDLIDYFGRLYDGHVCNAWIESKFEAHAVVEFDEIDYASKTIAQRKHCLENNVVILAWPYVTTIIQQKSFEKLQKPSTENNQDPAKRKAVRSKEGNGFETIFDRQRINEQEWRRREQIKEFLKERIDNVAVLPEMTLMMLGSSVNGFGGKSSDVDLTVLFDGSDDDEKDNRRRLTTEEYLQLDDFAKLEVLASCLRSSNNSRISEMVLIHGKRCPVIKFRFWNPTGQRYDCCELSIDNRSGLRKTWWIYQLNLRYRWLAPTYTVFRRWADRSRLTDRKGSSFNGYTLALILISYCQSQGLINNLDSGAGDPNGNTTEHLFQPLPMEKIDESELESFVKSLIGYLHNLSWKQTVFRPGETIGRVFTLIDYLQSGVAHPDFVYSSTNVQDPFDISHNTAANVSSDVVDAMQSSLALLINSIQSSSFDLCRMIESNLPEHRTELMGDEPTFHCEPSILSLKPLISETDQPIGDRWCAYARKAILLLFREVLQFRLADQSNGDIDCLCWHQIWNFDSRKRFSSRLMETASGAGLAVWSRYEWEKRVSEMIVLDADHPQNTGKKKAKRLRVEPAGQFSLKLVVVNSNGYQHLNGHITGDKHAYVFAKFLHTLIPLIFEDAIRRSILAGCDDPSHLNC